MRPPVYSAFCKKKRLKHEGALICRIGAYFTGDEKLASPSSTSAKAQ